MNKKLHLAFIALLITYIGFSQDLEKIKGSRNVITEITEIDKFHKIEIGDDFEIKLLQGLTPSIQIEADDNLFDALSFKVEEGVLEFSKQKHIRSKKKFEITVIYKDSLNVVELKNNAEISSGNKLNLENFTLITNDNTRAYLTIETNEFIFIQNEKNKTELNLTSKKATLRLNDNTSIRALINADEINIDMTKSAHAKIEGDTNNLALNINDNCVLKAEKLTSKDCSLTIKGKADAYIEVNKDLTLEASGSTETYIYGTPKVDLKTFEGNAVLKKK